MAAMAAASARVARRTVVVVGTRGFLVTENAGQPENRQYPEGQVEQRERDGEVEQRDPDDLLPGNEQTAIRAMLPDDRAELRLGQCADSEPECRWQDDPGDRPRQQDDEPERGDERHDAPSHHDETFVVLPDGIVVSPRQPRAR